MDYPMLLLVSSLKLVVEIAVMAMLGRWLLGLLAGHGRETNFFYRVLDVVAQPFFKLARAVAPRAVIDRHIPLAALIVLGLLWLLATFAKISLCLQIGVQLCR